MQPNPRETGDLVTSTEEILNGKFHFLCSLYSQNLISISAWIYEFRNFFLLMTNTNVSNYFNFN